MRVPAVVPRVRARVRLLAVWVGIVVVLGTIVTNTGPHAGDEEAKRFWGTVTDINGNALKWITRIHGVSVWVAAAIALSIFWSLRRLPNDRRVLDAPLTAWVVACVVQGSVGYVQYAAGLPVGLVAVHLAGGTSLVAITAWLWAATTKKAESAGEMVQRVSRQRKASLSE